MYITYFLKFSSKEEAEEKLVEAGYQKVTNSENNRVYFLIPDQLGSIDVVGEIYTEAGYRTGKLGYQIMVAPPVKKDGYHVNINSKQEIPELLKPFLVYPTKPSRVFL